MEKELAEKFNDVVERYRQALLHYARQCDWDMFKTKAGSLFDYVEVIELSEIERRFFRVFKSVLVVLVLAVAAIVNMDITVRPDLQRLRYTVIVLGIAGSCFEVYFFLTFRWFMVAKSLYHKKRKDRFIRNMEKDFRDFIAQRCAG